MPLGSFSGTSHWSKVTLPVQHALIIQGSATAAEVLDVRKPQTSCARARTCGGRFAVKGSVGRYSEPMPRSKAAEARVRGMLVGRGGVVVRCLEASCRLFVAPTGNAQNTAFACLSPCHKMASTMSTLGQKLEQASIQASRSCIAGGIRRVIDGQDCAMQGPPEI